MLQKVLEYFEHHKNDFQSSEKREALEDTTKTIHEFSEWDQEYISLDQEMLFDSILAADYLNARSLL